MRVTTSLAAAAAAVALFAGAMLPDAARSQGVEGVSTTSVDGCFPSQPVLYSQAMFFRRYDGAAALVSISGGADPLVNTPSVFQQSRSGVLLSQQSYSRAPLSVVGSEILTNPAAATQAAVTVMRFPSGLTVNVGREAQVWTRPHGTPPADWTGCWSAAGHEFWYAPGASQIYAGSTFPIPQCSIYSTGTASSQKTGGVYDFTGMVMIVPPVLRGFTCFPNRPVSQLPLASFVFEGVNLRNATQMIFEVSPWYVDRLIPNDRAFFLSVAATSPAENGFSIVRTETSGFNLTQLWMGDASFPGLTFNAGGPAPSQARFRASAAPTAFQIQQIEQELQAAGVSVQNHKRVIIATRHASFPEAQMIDGSDGPLCDRRRIETDAVIATAYYKLGGVYCSSLFRSTGGTGGTGGTNLNLGSTQENYTGGSPGQTNSGNARYRSNIGAGTRGSNSMAPGTGIPDSTSGLLGFEQMPR